MFSILGRMVLPLLNASIGSPCTTLCGNACGRCNVPSDPAAATEFSFFGGISSGFSIHRQIHLDYLLRFPRSPNVRCERKHRPRKPSYRSAVRSTVADSFPVWIRLVTSVRPLSLSQNGAFVENKRVVGVMFPFWGWIIRVWEEQARPGPHRLLNLQVHDLTQLLCLQFTFGPSQPQKLPAPSGTKAPALSSLVGGYSGMSAWSLPISAEFRNSSVINAHTCLP